MIVTQAAKDKLGGLCHRLGKSVVGLRFEGYVGTCRGSSPVLKPVRKPHERDVRTVVEGVTFFVPPDQSVVFEHATLDVDDALLGRGLTLTWPHVDGCRCQCSS